jgi:hypothetical protein
MINTDEFIRAWNERVGKQTAHIEFATTFFKKDEVYSFYNSIIERITVENKNILDYGFGGGLFYEWLINNHHIKSYYGLDIAPRQFEAMTKMIEKYKDIFDNSKIGLIDPNKIPNLYEINGIDILLAIEVLQHSPDKEYYNYLLSKFNESKIKTLALTYKRMDKLTFRQKVYKTTDDVANACHTTAEDIAEKLYNYKLIDNLSNNRLVIFKLKKQKGN